MTLRYIFVTFVLSVRNVELQRDALIGQDRVMNKTFLRFKPRFPDFEARVLHYFWLLLPSPSLPLPSAGLHPGTPVKPGEFLPGPLTG